MNRMSKLSAVLVALFFSAGVMAQSAPESNGGDNAKSDKVTAQNPADAAQKDTANAKMSKTTSTKKMQKPKKAKTKSSSGDMSNTTPSPSN
ncbi:MAG: hypothetical protein JWN80_3162 [Microbacteriaceae bacterium]|nr:hypothetical protein [Microbacteriaceae bacterium]